MHEQMQGCSILHQPAHLQSAHSYRITTMNINNQRQPLSNKNHSPRSKIGMRSILRACTDVVSLIVIMADMYLLPYAAACVDPTPVTPFVLLMIPMTGLSIIWVVYRSQKIRVVDNFLEKCLCNKNGDYSSPRKMILTIVIAAVLIFLFRVTQAHWRC